MKVAVFGTEEFYKEIFSKINTINKLNKIEIRTCFLKNTTNLPFISLKENFKILFFLCENMTNNSFKFVDDIKKINPICKIIFCCKTAKYAIKGYFYDVSHYLLLPADIKEMEYIVEKFLNFKKNKIIIKSNWQKIPIYLNDIQYAEKQGHNVIIYTSNNKFSTRSTFKDFVKFFENNSNFKTCIRGTLINFSWVKEISSQNFVMKNGQKIPIRRQDRKKFKDMFFDFQLKNKEIF